MGAGSFFFVGSLIYLIAALSAIALPPEQSDSKKSMKISERLLDEEALENLYIEFDGVGLF